jgi:RNA recognition motif-containing protein
MVKTIYVGNLPFSASEDDVRDLFSQYGAIHSVKMITDRETGKPRGFCFVDIDQDAANVAIEALNGKDFQGRNLRVNEAREKTSARR